ncbi:MAG TPA: MarR family transcriptional regulator [Pseudolysinimonas sp.]|jgi:DNA-binding MarR family transcriptional regulator
MINEPPAIGYLLKAAQSLLRLRMEESLKPLGLTVSHYSCLYRLQREPGISAADLARATFVTRQSMNDMLQTLLDRGLVDRATVASAGRALPVTLSAAGSVALDHAQAVVDAVEKRMLSGLAPAETRSLGNALAACVAALDEPPDAASE